jgi:hypothetical protein
MESNGSFFFMHVPKAGGTTLRTHGPEFLGLRKCTLTGCCISTAACRDRVNKTVQELQRNQCHFADFETPLRSFSDEGLMRPLAHMNKLVVVRQPHLHLISQLEHDFRQRHRYNSLDGKLSIIHANRWDDWKRGGYKLKNPQYNQVIGSLDTRSTVFSVWEKLTSTYHSIGLQEHMDLTLCVFYFNIHDTLPAACCTMQGPVVGRKNRSKQEQLMNNHLRTEQIRRAQQWRQLDEIMYSAAQTIFWMNAANVAQRVTNCPWFHYEVQERALSNVTV